MNNIEQAKRKKTIVMAVTSLAIVVLVAMAAYVLNRQLAISKQALIAQLTEQADAWDKAIVRKDEAAIAANMADDFRQIDHEGKVTNKATFLKGIVSPKLRIDPYPVDELEVRLYGEVALVSGRTRMTGAYDGHAFTAHYRYIDVYAREKGKWQVVSVQISPLPL